MAHEIKQDIKLSQQLIMSPQLQLAIKLLQLSRLELEELVKEEMELNPVLEEDSNSDEYAASAQKDEGKEIDWETYLAACQERSFGINFSEESDEAFLETTIAKKTTLADYLMWQLQLSSFSQEEESIGEFIIGNIDEDGYLRMGEGDGGEDQSGRSTVQEIAAVMGSSEDVIEATINKIQQFDPVGVCARTLKECLLIQARFLGCNSPLIEEIVKNHLNNLERKNYKLIASTLKVRIDEVFEAVRVIMGLNPRPGSTYGYYEENVIIPDVYIEKVSGDYVILLNENGLPRLRISQYYRSLIAKNGRGTNETKTYIQDKLRSAKWLIQSIQQRQRTIYKVVQSIVRFQREFFDYGACYLKPLVLRNVAEDIGMHESTVSRVTTNKYANTPHGIFELKHFFSAGVNRDDGTAMASKSIMEKLKNICEREDPTRPLSDQKIADILKKSGINVARRTVTKYREAMGILPANKRKQWF